MRSRSASLVKKGLFLQLQTTAAPGHIAAEDLFLKNKGKIPDTFWRTPAIAACFLLLDRHNMTSLFLLWAWGSLLSILCFPWTQTETHVK